MYFKNPLEVSKSSSNTIIFPCLFTISVTPSIIETARPLFFEDSTMHTSLHQFFALINWLTSA
jgi:hypothetical protein